MCGIVGFTGHRAAAPILLNGLSMLEYRGYDSAGLAVRDGMAPTAVVKATGKLKNLIEKTEAGATMPGCCGIGHTRWATHGEPNQTNAHPHISANDMDEMGSEVVGVHNGIIENYAEIKQKLLKNGYRFYSGTDTEVAIKLVDYYYRKYKIGPIDAINRMMVRVRGSYALALMFKDYPGEIYAARKDSPLVIGVADGETFLASDVPALLQHTRDVYYIDNHQSARLLPGEAHFFDLNGDEVQLPLTHVTWSAEAAQKGGYEHFMIKEIHEQPKAVRDTLNSLVHDGRIDLSAVGVSDEQLSAVESVEIVACGSAWHVGMAAQYVIEDMAEVPVRVELASEFRYRKRLLGPGSLVIVISQSGETADSLAALRAAKAMGVPTLAVVNVVGSSIAREADHVLYTLAGPEIAVATTKAYSAQLSALYAFALELALVKGKLNEERYGALIGELLSLPRQRPGHLLHRPGPRLRHLSGGEPEDEGDLLHPQRGLRRRRAKARHHQPGGGRDPDRGGPDPAGRAGEDRQQHGRVPGPGRVPGEPGRGGQPEGERLCGLLPLRAGDGPPFHGEPGHHPPAASGLLHQRLQGPGRG